MDEQSVKKLAQLIIDIQGVSNDLRKKRIHPLDIIPIENPTRLAKRLDKAVEDFSKQ